MSQTSNNQIDKLKCAFCKSPLSFFPIYISRDGKQNVCSRFGCFDPEFFDHVRNEAYEVASAFIRFPCRFQGCIEEKFPNEVPKHEDYCVYRHIECPQKTITGCGWSGRTSSLLEHLKNFHSDSILEDGIFEVDLSASMQDSNFLIYDQVLLIFKWIYNCETSIFKFRVRHLAPSSLKMLNYDYKIIFISGNNSLITNSYITEGEELNAVNLESLKEPDSLHKLITAKIEITKDEPGDWSTKNEELLAQLKCSDCLAFALPPIYQYGDKIKCSDCREKCNKTSVSQKKMNDSQCCYQSVDNTYGNPVTYYNYSTIRSANMIACSSASNISSNEIRNFNLDNIANLLDYPCKNRNSGCNFVSKPEKIRLHQINCYYGALECPLNGYTNCNWKGIRKDFPTHLRTKHENHIIKASTEKSTHFNFSEKCYIIEFSNHYFRLSFENLGPNSTQPRNMSLIKRQLLDHFKARAQNMMTPRRNNFEHFRFAMQKITYEHDVNYDIEFIDNKKQGKKLLVREACSELTEKSKIFDSDNNFCSFDGNYIQSFASEKNILTFKIHIVE